MATNIQDQQPHHPQNRRVLWVLVALAAALLAYGVYATYYQTDVYQRVMSNTANTNAYEPTLSE